MEGDLAAEVAAAGASADSEAVLLAVVAPAGVGNFVVFARVLS